MAPIELENKADEEQRLVNGGDHNKTLPRGSPEKIVPADTLKPSEKPAGPKENGSFDDVGSASDLLSETQTPCMSPRRLRRERLWSGSAKDDTLLLTRQRTIYTAGRPPWYNVQGQLMEPFVIGICGGSASGKTTVAKKIIEALNVPWVTLLSMDSFYKVLDAEQHRQADENQFNFDHPDAFDFDLLIETLKKLKEGKRVEVPIYNFVTHAREKRFKFMYGANVIIFEGILCFTNKELLTGKASCRHQSSYHICANVIIFEGILCFTNKELLTMMDMKIFIDTDSDIRLARRLQRDITDRGRDLEGCLAQYERFVKPAFDHYIAPSMVHADLIVPRGGENHIAINLIVQHVHTQLVSRGLKLRSKMAESHTGQPLPASLHLLPQTPQLRGIHTFIRNRATQRDEFIFYSKRLMRLLMEYTVAQLPFQDVAVETPQGISYNGKRSAAGKICGVSILRAGETMEQALCDVLKDVRLGKILIQTNQNTGEPELYYLRLPKDIKDYTILLMDATVATGAASIMAVRVLLDHDVPEENIMLVSLLMAESGVHSVAYAFPKVRIITTAVDPVVTEKFYIEPGIGNFGDRYFGTEALEYL